jgi:hypothetical protein
VPLTGPTRARLSGPVPLTLLSFGAYGGDLAVMPAPPAPAAPAVIKGAGAARYSADPRAYVLSTTFELPAAASSSNSSSHGIRGRSVAIGDYVPDLENPRRLAIAFRRMRLEPASEEAGFDLGAWTAALGARCPGLGADGALEVELPAAPAAWQDYLLMTRGVQLVRGSAGSATLLLRVEA